MNTSLLNWYASFVTNTKTKPDPRQPWRGIFCYTLYRKPLTPRQDGKTNP